MTWSHRELPSLDGRRVYLTGANSGIGWEAAWMLAERGAHVILACRDPGRAQDALERLRAKVPHASAELARLDLADLASVRAAAAAVEAPIDILVNNAGVMALPLRHTPEGFEAQLGTNHFGPFLLTSLLLPRLAPGGRIVTVSSGMHWVGWIDFANLDGERFYQPWVAYNQSKLANLLFAGELDRRLRAHGLTLASVACHPGLAATNLQAAGPKMAGDKLAERFAAGFNRVLPMPAWKGALPTVYAAAHPDVTGGDYIGPALVGWGWPTRALRSPLARDEGVARRLWGVSEARTGTTFLPEPA